MKAALVILGGLLCLLGIMLFGAGLVTNARGFNTEWFIIPGGLALTAGRPMIAWSQRL